MRKSFPSDPGSMDVRIREKGNSFRPFHLSLIIVPAEGKDSQPDFRDR